MQNETVTNVFWGVWLVWFGVVAALRPGGLVGAVEDPYFALGTGFLLIILNFSRSLLRLKLSSLTIGLGALLVVIYAPTLLIGISIPFLPALVIIIGIALIIGAFRTGKFL
jgi:hypothetical protein